MSQTSRLVSMTATKNTQKAQQEPREAKPSAKVPEVGRMLWYRSANGPAFALVTAASEGEAEVLVLRPDEVVKARSVTVYDTAEDAERGAAEGREHVAWHPA